MRYGSKNLAFGFIYIIFTLALGLLIVLKFKIDPSFAKEGFAFPRVIMRAAHAHGNLESVLNIIIGLVVDRTKVADNLKQTISVLMIIGALMHSGMLYITPVIPFAANFSIIGALSIIATMILMSYSVIKGIE